MNKWYNRIVNNIPNPQSNITKFQNPVQQAQYIMNAIRNPAAFIQEQFPDVPEDIRNNPNDVLNYLQKTRGNKLMQDIQRISVMNGRR